MVVVEVEDRDPGVAGELLGGDGGVVEVAEPAEGAALGMVARRPDQRVGEPATVEHCVGCGQGAIDRASGGAEGVPVERREGVDAVVAGSHLELFGRAGVVADGKDVRVDRPPVADPGADPFEIAHIASIVDREDVAIRELTGRDLFEEAGRVDLATDGRDPHRRLDIAALANVVDEVEVVDDEGDSLVGRWLFGLGDTSAGRLIDVAEWPQLNRIVLERCRHPFDVLRWTELAVLAVENRPDRVPHLRGRLRPVRSEGIEHQVGRLVVIRGERGLVLGADDRTRAETLVKAKPGCVLASMGGVLAERRVVGEALEEDAPSSEFEGVPPNPFVERAADAATARKRTAGEELEPDKADLDLVVNEGESLDRPPLVFHDVEKGSEAVPDGVPESSGKPIDLLFLEPGKTVFEHRLDLLDGDPVR